MAIKLNCERPRYTKEVHVDTQPWAIQLLQLQDAQAHSIANKPEKPQRPQLVMIGDAVKDTDWAQFVFKSQHYKTLAWVTTDSASHL